MFSPETQKSSNIQYQNILKYHKLSKLIQNHPIQTRKPSNQKPQPTLQSFKILHKLGEGSYSTVYKVKRSQDNHTYAMKRIKMYNLNEKERQNALNEIRFLASINNKHIINYKQAFYDDSS